MYNNNIPNFSRNMSNKRNGGFLFPFILGSLVSPIFGNKNNNQPCCWPQPTPYPYPYPYPTPYYYGNPNTNQFQPDYYQNYEIEKNYYI